MVSVNGSDFAFVNDDLDNYLDDLSSKLKVSGKEPRACALTHLGSAEPVRKQLGAYSTSVTREFEGPKSISCFDYEIKLSSPVVNSIKTTFAQEPCGLKSTQVLMNLRFPPKLKKCYVKDYDFEKEILELSKSRKPRTRRRGPRRTRYSLSENVHVNDDNYRRANLLPTEDDLRTTYDKVFPCRVPYLFGCDSDGGPNCVKRCAEKVDGFRLFIEIPQDGRPVHPIVSENLAKVFDDAGAVDSVRAMVAVTALRTPSPPKSRVLLPFSQDLTDRIGVLSEVFDVDDYPIDSKDDSEVCRVLEDIVEFVVKQSSFPEPIFDPDCSDDSFNLNGSADVSQNLDDVICQNLDDATADVPSDDSSSTSPAKVLKKIRKKKRVEKNKVVRELKKLLNISVMDEDEAESNTKVCDEPTCVLGCVCASLANKPPPAEHCGQARCMFGCSCERKWSYVSEGDLAKEEKSWHQTVVRKGNAVELQSGLERSKRRSKLPSKFEDTFTGQHLDHIVRSRKLREKVFDEEAEEETELSGWTKFRPTVVDEKPEDNEESPVEDPLPKTASRRSTNFKRSMSMKKKSEHIKKTMMSSRLALCGTDKVKTLDQVFIWCAVHDKYDCHCSNYVVLTRNSNLLFMAGRTNRYTARKRLGQKSLRAVESPENRTVRLWDEKHCARSFGTLLNYTLRNKNVVYKKMMKRVLLEEKKLSFSNGYVKTRPVALQQPDELLHNMPAISARGGVGTVFHGPTGKKLIVTAIADNASRQTSRVKDSKESADDTDSSRTELDSSDIVPMPRKRRTDETCLSFSLFDRNAPKRSRSVSRAPSPEDLPEDESTSDSFVAPIINDKTPVLFGDPGSDHESDVEFVEEPMEVVSIPSSSEDEADSELPDGASDQLKPRKIQPPSNVSSVSSQPIQVDSPISIPSDGSDQEKELSDDDDGDDARAAPVTQPQGTTDPDEDYPLFGLCNLRHKEYGYIPLLDTSGSTIKIQIPGESHFSRTFKDVKEASNYLMTVVGKILCVPKTEQHGEWCKVTRGVLVKLQVKKFPNPELLRDKRPLKLPSTPTDRPLKPAYRLFKRPSVESTPPSLLQAVPEPAVTPRDGTPDKKKAKVVIENEKQLIRSFNLSRTHKDSAPVSGDSHETVQSENPKDAEAAVSDGEKSAPPVPAAMNVVGTFSSMSEANSFIQKNFSPVSQVVRTAPHTTYTTLKSIINPGATSPNPAPTSGTPVSLVNHKTMVVRAKLPGPVKLAPSTSMVRMINGQMIRLASHPVSPGAIVSGSATTGKSCIANVTTPATMPYPLRIVMPHKPGIVLGTGHLKIGPPGLVIKPAPQTPRPARTLLPKTDAVRVRPLPRKAEVIVAKDTGFATVISPAPAQTAVVLTKEAPKPNDVAKPTAVCPNKDSPKTVETVKSAPAVICDRSTVGKFKSLLPHKSPPLGEKP